MSAALTILLAIVLVRWIAPALWTYLTAGGFGGNRRGRVAGHRGPGAFSFNGRAGRREWWLTTLGIIVISAFISLAPTIGPLLTLPWVIMTFAVNARRLHDLSLPAWVQVIPLGFGLVFAVLHVQFGGPDTPPALEWTFDTASGWYTLAATAWVLAYIGFYALCGFAPGRRGPNPYGEADLPA